MTRSAILGLDLGTSAVKAVLVDATGDLVALGRAPFPTRRDAAGMSEQDPAAWKRAAAGAVAACLAQATDCRVEALGPSGQMSAPVLVDAAGTELAPCHTLTDRRAELDAAAVPGEIQAEITARTGNRVAGFFTLPKLLWWGRNHPALLERTAAILAPKDYLRAWMTGALATDPTDAGNMLLLDASRRSWMKDLVIAVGLAPRLLPPLQEPSTIGGRLRRDVAAALGLPPDLPVAVGAADMAAALLGTQVHPADDLAVTIGTSATVIAGMPGIVQGLIGRLTFHPGIPPGTLYALASHFGGGACLDWFLRIIGGTTTNFMALAAEAAAVPPGAEGLLFMPYLLGAGSPSFDPGARGAFHGLVAGHGRAHLLRAIVEGISADLCSSIRLLRQPATRRRIVLGGGGANFGFWPQLLADMSGLPVATAPTHDASATGAALIAGRAVGWFEAMPDADRHTHYAPSPAGPYSDLLDRFETARQTRL